MRTPFPLPSLHRRTLRKLPSCGFWKLDVRVKGKWDGILAVTPDFSVAGVYVRGKIEAWNLPFASDDIEAVRPASMWRRIFARCPELFIFGFPCSSILLAAPILLGLGILFHWAFFLACFGVLAGAVMVIGYVGRAGGYCVLGGPLILATLVQLLIGLFGLWVFS